MTITIRLPIDAGSDRGDDEGAAQAAPIEPEPAPVQS
jgi:hypothetical protein